MSRLRSLIAFALVAGLFYAGLSFVYKPIQLHQDELHIEITELEQNIISLNQRLTALDANKIDIAFPEPLLWRAATKADVELALQNRMVNLAEQHQLTLINFGSSTLSREVSQQQIALELEGEAPLGEFYSFLTKLEQLDQKVAIAALRLRPIQHKEEAPTDVNVYIQMTLWAFWESSS